MDSLLKQYDGTGLAELVKSKQLHPSELVQQAIDSIESQNNRLNAVVHKMYDQAFKQAQSQSLAGAFAGVPMLLKDINQELQGEPMAWGSRAYKNHRAKEDSLYSELMRQAGFLFVGYSNVPEFALTAVTESQHYGPARNPWGDTFTPGGSSGGSAAAVASGMVPLAGASDGGGSIRIPASYCGLFGLKPTRGRTPVGPQFGRHWQGASVNHVLTKSVRDSAGVLDVLSAKIDKAGAYNTTSTPQRYVDIIQQPLRRPLRIAFSTESPLGTAVHPDCRQAVFNAAELLASLGHEVIEQNAPVDGRQIARSYITMYFGEVGAELRALERYLQRKVKRSDVEPVTWLLGTLGRSTSAEEFVWSMRAWDEAAYQMALFHDTVDLYMTPTTAMPPAQIGELDLKANEKLLVAIADKMGIAKLLKRVGLVDTLVENSLQRTPFTQLANLTGQPAMSVPLYRMESGLPLGVQLIAGREREDLLLQVASQLEQTDAWIHLKNLQRVE